MIHHEKEDLPGTFSVVERRTSQLMKILRKGSNQVTRKQIPTTRQSFRKWMLRLMTLILSLSVTMLGITNASPEEQTPIARALVRGTFDLIVDFPTKGKYYLTNDNLNDFVVAYVTCINPSGQETCINETVSNIGKKETYIYIEAPGKYTLRITNGSFATSDIKVYASTQAASASPGITNTSPEEQTPIARALVKESLNLIVDFPTKGKYYLTNDNLNDFVVAYVTCINPSGQETCINETVSNISGLKTYINIEAPGKYILRITNGSFATSDIKVYASTQAASASPASPKPSSTPKPTPTPSASAKASPSSSSATAIPGVAKNINGRSLANYKFNSKKDSSLYIVRLKNKDLQISWFYDKNVTKYEFYWGDAVQTFGRAQPVSKTVGQLYWGQTFQGGDYYPSEALTYRLSNATYYSCLPKNCLRFGNNPKSYVFYTIIPAKEQNFGILGKQFEEPFLVAIANTGKTGYYSHTSISTKSENNGFLPAGWLCRTSAYGLPVAQVAQKISRIGLSIISYIPGFEIAGFANAGISAISAIAEQNSSETAKAFTDMTIEVALNPEMFEVEDVKITPQFINSLIKERLDKLKSFTINSKKIPAKVKSYDVSTDAKKFLDSLRVAAADKNYRKVRQLIADSKANRLFGTYTVLIDAKSNWEDGKEILRLATLEGSKDTGNEISNNLQNCN